MYCVTGFFITVKVPKYKLNGFNGSRILYVSSLYDGILILNKLVTEKSKRTYACDTKLLLCCKIMLYIKLKLTLTEINLGYIRIK